jgi:histidine triad (HIT) family protein
MCLFCKSVSREVPGKIVYEDEDVLAFSDVRPVAPTHALVIPKRHVASLNELEPGDAELVGKMVLAAKKVAADAGISQSGWRLVVNTGPDAGQSVFHIHAHVLGGRGMGWPPG